MILIAAMWSWILKSIMSQNDQSNATITLQEWLRQGRSFFNAEQLARIVMLLIDDDALSPTRPARTTPEVEDRHGRTPVIPTAEESMARTSTPSIPLPDDGLSVPKVIAHFVRYSNRGVRTSELTSYVRSVRPGKAKTSVYTALHSLCEAGILRKEGSGRDYTYFFVSSGPRRGGKSTAPGKGGSR